MEALPLQAPSASPWRRTLHGSWRTLPAALRESLTSRAAWSSALAALACGFLLSTAIACLLPDPPGNTGISSAGLAASYLLNLCVLGAALSLLSPAPSTTAVPWKTLRGWLRLLLITLAAVCGWVLAPAARASWKAAFDVAVVTGAQSSVLAGMAGLLSCFWRRSKQMSRATLLFVACVAVSAIFWSRPMLMSLSTQHPRAAEAATQAVLTLCPISALAAAWSGDGQAVDLLNGGNTYSLWLGHDRMWAYPKIWPGWEGAGADGRRLFDPGLVLALLIWGLAMLTLSDLLEWSGAHTELSVAPQDC